MRDVEVQVCDYATRHSERFAEWIPNNLKIASATRIHNQPLTAACIGNTTAINETISRLCRQFSCL